jgi:hypothetical protein
MPRIDWQIWFEALYFERLISDPFALSTYQRFLEVMVTEDLETGDISINNFVKKEDQRVLGSLPFADKQNYINRLQLSINSHLKNSYWFARFLSKIARLDPMVRGFFESDNISDIKSLRISLYQYSFSNDPEDRSNWWNINTNNSPSIIIDLK